ncbi:MAG: O-antigen ligase family protein [Limisphaerales bacterium]
MHRRITDILIVLITILAPSLGGSTELWAQGILALGLGLVLLIDPPRRLPPRWMLWTAGALLLLPWTAFLPVSWTGEMPYRVLLREEANLELGPFITIQPWLTLEGILLWTLGILWSLVLVTRSWSLHRVTLIRLYLLGMVGLALCALTFYTSNSAPEIWVNHGRFGFFENRNQTGNVLALAGILALALGGRDLLRGRLWGWGMFGISLMLAFSVVINGSRAGVLLYLGGCFIWTVWTAASRRSARRLGWGLASLLGLLTLFLTFGGPTLDRFIHPGEEPPSLLKELSLRTDPGAYHLAQDASWHGIGLGNFEAVFNQYEEQVVPYKRAIHPESDWIWALIELGWITPILLLGSALVWLIQHRPRTSQPDFLIRTGLAVASGCFLLHGIADVSGHRPGSLWPALLFLALLRHPWHREPVSNSDSPAPGSQLPAPNPGSQQSYPLYPLPDAAGLRAPSSSLKSLLMPPIDDATSPPPALSAQPSTPTSQRSALSAQPSALTPQRLSPLPSRITGLLAAALAVIWILPPKLQPFPTSALETELNRQLEPSITAQAHDQTRTIVDQLLEITPLNPQLHFARGLAGVYGNAPMEEAMLDFTRTRKLDRRDPPNPQSEATAWLTRAPSLAFSAWNETLRRAGTNRAAYYTEILAIGSPIPSVRHELFSLAFGDPDLILEFLEHGPDEERADEIDKWLLDDPELRRFSAPQRSRFLLLWAVLGNPETIAAWLDNHPDAATNDWLTRAYIAARLGQFDTACQITSSNAPQPTLPTLQINDTRKQLERRIKIATHDFAARYALFQILNADPADPDILQLLQTTTQLPSCPGYFFHLHATHLTQLEQFEPAWSAWKRYFHTTARLLPGSPNPSTL